MEILKSPGQRANFPVFSLLNSEFGSETSGKFGNTLAEMLAVSKSPDRGASSGEASAGEIASAPANPAVQFTSAGPLSFVLAGRTPVPIQIWPCCCDNVQK